MPFLKPLFKTLILSSLVFLFLVLLGSKYHWVSFMQNHADDNNKLIVKKNSPPSQPDSIKDIMSENKDTDSLTVFTPQIIDEEASSHLLTNMTKTQIADNCKILLNTLSRFDTPSELFVGNCVISNYTEDYQETDAVESFDKREVELLMIKALNMCKSQLSAKHLSLSAIEEELMLGICVSAQN